MNIFQQLGGKIPILANRQEWFTQAGGKHRSHVEQSDDLRVVRDDIRLARQFGIAGFVVDWYGFNPDQAGPTHVATKELMVLCEYEGFNFCVMADAGIYKWRSQDPAARNAIFQEALGYIGANFCTSPAYFKLPSGKPLVFEFGTRVGDGAVDLAAAAAANTGMAIFSQDSGVTGGMGTYGWVNGVTNNLPGQQTPADWQRPLDYMRGYLNLNDTVSQQPACKIPPIFWGFDDHDPNNPANSIWGGKARYIDGRNGDLGTDIIRMLLAWQAGTLGVGAANCPAIQICTWNDYDEGTKIQDRAKEEFLIKLDFQ